MTGTLGDLDFTDCDFAFEDIPDLHRLLADLRARKPYALVPHGGRKAVLLLTEELVAAAFRDERTFPANAIYPYTTGAVLGRTLQCMTGREHRVNKALASPPFRRLASDALAASTIRPLAHRLVDDFADRGHADLVAEFAAPFPVRVISALLGLPEWDVDDMARWAHALFTFPLDPDGAVRASREFTERITPVLAERRAAPGDDLVSALVAHEVDGERLTDEEVLAFLRLLFPAGADTTHLALGSILSALLTHPDQLDRVRADEAEIRWAVAEGLRWEPPVALLPRVCPDAVTWQGIDIPAGTTMIFAITAANRDPAVYPEPDRFDITRRVLPSTAFGGGPHSCLGVWLAQAELRTALSVLLARLPGLRLREGAEPAAKVSSQIASALRGPDALHVEWDV
ncbi:cytochrome P450 [Saccharopolyspora rosea]|uniref:Cytochrome P450 n=1 Tax=Saccharopolyspora rosea TaxID=524884 RepID=A0ABW3FVJ1_9PSEU|nr:cytochrome P450 [Saccharopolyspora rosea]